MQKPKEKGYILSKQELRSVQLIQCEMLQEVDRLCKKGNIRYCIVGGTALGAARHGGFIPWDDDADVGFLRAEYEKFRVLCETDLDQGRFYFQDYRNTNGYRWGYGKLRRKGTQFVRLQQEHMPYAQGIFIDLFPFDFVPDFYPLRCLHSLCCFLYRKIFWSAIGRTTGKGIAKYIYNLLYLLPEKQLYDSFERFIKKTNQNRTNMVRILTFPTASSDYGYNVCWYEKLQKIEFEGLLLMIAEDYDGYLKVKYGEYMKLPPPEKRKTHPISKLQLLQIPENEDERRRLSEKI